MGSFTHTPKYTPKNNNVLFIRQFFSKFGQNDSSGEVIFFSRPDRVARNYGVQSSPVPARIQR